MDIRELSCFKKVAELESINKAANELYISRAQASRLISNLEQEFGVLFFDRVNRTIKLNDTGRVFYRYCTMILKKYKQAAADIHEISMQQSSQVSVATNVSAYMPGFLSLMAEKHPDISTHEGSAPRDTLVSMLRNRHVNFAITAPPITDLDITTEILFDDRPVVVYEEGHWLKDYARIAPAELRDESFIGAIPGYGIRDLLDEFHRNQEVPVPHYVVETSNAYAIEQYVEAGLGIAIVPKSITLESAFLSDHFVELEGDFLLPVGISRRKNEPLSHAGKQFLEAAHAYFDEYAGNISASTSPAGEDSMTAG